MPTMYYPFFTGIGPVRGTIIYFDVTERLEKNGGGTDGRMKAKGGGTDG